MAEKHPDVKFEYSFSDGKYWSPYDHCRIWENGTYDLMIRDNYGQTAKRVYEETNVVEDIGPHEKELFADPGVGIIEEIRAGGGLEGVDAPGAEWVAVHGYRHAIVRPVGVDTHDEAVSRFIIEHIGIKCAVAVGIIVHEDVKTGRRA